MKINTKAIGEFYRRLNHTGYGITELVVIDPTGRKGIIATGFFDDEDAFVKACQAYNGRYNIYAGRNPRPRWFPKVCENYLDVRYKQRASDKDIEYITAISLDIDPVRPKGTSSTERQHKMAIKYALKLQQILGGCVDDSGNGAYLWFQFIEPIKVTDRNREILRLKCQRWQRQIVEKYRPERYGLKIDSCFDLSRIKKVIGTLSVKGKVHRLSRFVFKSKPSDEVRDTIIAMPVDERPKRNFSITQPSLPVRFVQLLHSNHVIKQLWCTPDENNDTSRHDWKLGCACIQAGIVKPEELAAILMHNPFGKYQRDKRDDYIRITVSKLIEDEYDKSG